MVYRGSTESGSMKRLVVVASISAVSLALVSTWIHLELPNPTGPYSVGRLEEVWTDNDRPETHTADATDSRQVGVVMWYPAVDDSGEPATYLPRHNEMADAMRESGEVNPIAAWGLQFVRGHAHEGADVDSSETSYPVVLLSPGNATNVEFYGSMAEDLASHGYVVVGVNHPYQVAAAKLADGSLALYQEDVDVPAKIDERLLDLRFVINRLEQEAENLLDSRLNLDSLGVMGHSNGGLAAVELCKADPRLDACLNIDGQAGGGALGTSPDDRTPDQSFMFLTKELNLHPEIESRFENGRHGGYRVVIPAASHEEFADGALFAPSFWPFARTADRINQVTRGFTNAFFDLTLKGAPQTVLGEVSAPTDVHVYVYPLTRSG